MVDGKVCTVRKSGVNSCMVEVSETIGPSSWSISWISTGAVTRKTCSIKSRDGQPKAAASARQAVTLGIRTPCSIWEM